MRRYARLFLAIIFTLSLPPGCVAAADDSAIAMSDYRTRLSEIAAKADSLGDHPEQASQLVSEIPDQLTVATGTRNITINFRYLKDDLAGFSSTEASQRQERLSQIRNYLGELQLAADNVSPPDKAQEREKLDEILARREFHKVRGPGAREALLAKIYRWLARWFFKFHLETGATSNWLQGLVYSLVGATLLAALIWTVTRLRRKEDEIPAREIMPFSPSAKNWRTWLAEARQAADMQDWRNAIHLAYWAGISSLESGGAWKPNRARTPREYLRLVGSRNPHHSPLKVLTRKFEFVWYGEHEAAEADYRETLAQLEQLGCR